MDIYEVRQQLSSGKNIYELPLRVTYYARVSTDKDEQAGSLKNQVEYYSDYIKKNKNWSLFGGYVDEGISGSSVGKRADFLRMVEDARLGKFDFIITKEISRFSRNTMDSIRYTQELIRYGVGVLFQSDNINTLMPDSELRLTIMSSIAQDEVRKISERVKFGFRRSIEQGRVLGSNRIWGYTKDDGKLVIDPQEAELVRTIFDLYANHDIGMRGIAQQLSEQGYSNSEGNSFSFSTIKGILTNPKYKGYYCGNKSHKLDYKSKEIKNLAPADWTMYKDEAGDTVPAIVTEEVWDRANKILAQRSAKMSSDNPTSYQNKYTYSGKLLCMEHHQPFYRALYRYDSGNKELWQCKCYIEKGKAGCASPAVYTEELNEIMHGCYEDLIINKADIVHELVTMYSTLSQSSGLQGELEKQRQQGNEVLRRKDKLLDLSLKGRITDEEFETRNATFNKELEQLRQEADRLTEGIALNSSMKQSVETLRGVIQREIDFTDGLPDNVVDGLLDRVEVYKSGDRHKVELKVYFKVIEEPAACRIARSRGNTSVCSRQYI